MELQDVKWNGQAREIQAVASGEFSAAEPGPKGRRNDGNGS